MLTKRHSFLWEFLKLPREKTVKYFSISVIPHDIKPMISQTKKNGALYHARSLSYFAREVREKRGYTYGAHCISKNFTFYCLHRFWRSSFAWYHIMDPWYLPIQFFWKHCVSSIVSGPVSVAMVGVLSTPGASSPSAWHGTPARPARSRSFLSPYPAAAAYCFMCFWWSIPVLYWKNLHSVPLVYWLICTWSFHLGKSVQCRFTHKRCCEWALGG